MTQQVTETVTIDQQAIQQAGRYVADWKRSLLDLSRRNRLIDFRRGLATRVAEGALRSGSGILGVPALPEGTSLTQRASS